ncbi:MAG: DNA N-6-adenine-methyltransferase [Candidatus Thiodiazotropha sp.]
MTQIRVLLVNKSYQAKVKLTLECLQELRWWISQMQNWNGKSIITAGPDLTISTDASKKGWGAALGKRRAQGLWTLAETEQHINVLELKAALFALRTFAFDLRKVHVHLKMDNRTSVAFIQKMGGTRSTRMLPLTQEIWNFALEREITLTAEYLPGSLNTDADWQSRNYHDSSDWKLKESVFQQLNRRWGPFKLDLFASRHNAQLQKYVSWFPDPFALEVDAFQRQWKEEGLYLFPPFAMIPRCLMKVRQESASVVLIAPTWQTQPWFPILLSMLSEEPILLPPYKDLLSSPSQQFHPLAQQSRFRLAAWKICGDEILTREFQRRLPNYW